MTLKTREGGVNGCYLFCCGMASLKDELGLMSSMVLTLGQSKKIPPLLQWFDLPSWCTGQLWMSGSGQPTHRMSRATHPTDQTTLPECQGRGSRHWSPSRSNVLYHPFNQPQTRHHEVEDLKEQIMFELKLEPPKASADISLRVVGLNVKDGEAVRAHRCHHPVHCNLLQPLVFVVHFSHFSRAFLQEFLSTFFRAFSCTTDSSEDIW